jgi:anti-sigma factor ChrR (cupin superfamily)
MDCVKFQDSLSDYLESALDSRSRAECAAHRLVCGECRELFNDVRATVQALNSVAHRVIAEPEGLQDRILSATTTGEMLSCGEFDRLLERYFDGVILAPTFQTFQTHFESCAKCRRLLNGIEEAIAMCHEVKEAEVEVPDSLYDRIVAATVGAKSGNWFERAQSNIADFGRRLASPQMAVAAMIIAAISLLILSRFGSVANLTEHAEQKAESIVSQSQQKISSTGAKAKSGFQFLFGGGMTKQEPDSPPSDQPRIQPSPQPRPVADSDPASTNRDRRGRRPNQNKQQQ